MTTGVRPSEVVVHLDSYELGPARAIGSLRLTGTRGRSAVSFTYGDAWLDRRDRFSVDPSLQLVGGTQYVVDGGLPGAFADAAPDRWGRTLLERRETIMARREARRPRTLDEWDFLLGVNDRVRMGALRLADGDGEFLDAGPLAVPPITRLRELESAARGVEMHRAHDDDAMNWLSLLIAPGSSLGGARPKANFVAEDGRLWIAKFPSQADRHDVGAWEYILARLALRAGITMPDIHLLDLGGEYRTFAAQRFDRAGDARLLYVSGMTLVGTRDGGASSYLDLALAIADHGAHDTIDADLEQLFRRLVFNVVMSNRDDHLRNHGFLRTSDGWRLAPAFDLNPAPEKADHVLAIDDHVRVPDLALVRETSAFYRLSPARAGDILDEVLAVATDWRAVATREAGLRGDEMDFVGRAFLV